MTAEKVLTIDGGSDDLAQIVKTLAGKCSAEETEYRTTTRLLKRYKRVLVWLVIWFVAACIAAAFGNGGPMLWAVLVYLIVLLAVAAYILASLSSIGKTEIAEPSIRQQAVSGSDEYQPDQVEDLFNYYWAIDKRNDRVSTTTAVAGAIIGVSTLVLVVALVTLFALGM